MGLHRGIGAGLDGEPALGREADGAEDAHRILAHADVGIADGADEPRAQVGLAADVIDHPALVHFVEEAVDGEIAPAGVLLLVAEDVVVADEEVLGEIGQLVERVGAEGGDLDDLPALVIDVGEAEAAADEPRVAEGRLDLVRVRGGGDVEVLGVHSEEQVANAPADEIGGEVGLLEPSHHLHGVGIEPLLPDLGPALLPFGGRGLFWRPGRGVGGHLRSAS